MESLDETQSQFWVLEDSDIELLESVDNSGILEDDEVVIVGRDPIKVDGTKTAAQRIEELEKALLAAQNSLVTACLKVQELEKGDTNGSPNFQVMQLRLKLLKSKLAKGRLRNENTKLRHQLVEAEELYSVIKKRNEELVGEINELQLRLNCETNGNSAESDSSDSPEKLPEPSPKKKATRELTCVLDKPSEDPKKFADYFSRFRKRHAIIPRDVMDYWKTKEETEITYNEVRMFETKRLPLDRMQEMIPVLKAFLDDLSRGVLDLNSFQNRKYRHFTPEASKVLQREFESNRNPSKAKIESLASQFRVNAVKVRNWFREKKRRNKVKARAQT